MSLIKQAQRNATKYDYGTEEFKYDLVKKRFITALLYGSNVERPLLRREVKRLIHNIKNKKLESDKYSVINQCDKDRLIIKRIGPKEQIAEVLPFSELFNVITEAHLAMYHLNKDTLFDILKRRYSVLIEWVSIFTRACNVCSILKYTSVPKNHLRLKSKVAQVIVLKRFLLHGREAITGIIYIDYLTNYVLLRKASDKTDIAYELFKIFMDFGVPDCLEVSNKVLFNDEIVSTLCELIPDCAVKIIERKLLKYNELLTTTTWNLKVWSAGFKNMKCNNLMFKILDVQWQLNQRIRPVGIRNRISTEITKETAYSAIFNRNVEVKFRAAPYPEEYKKQDKKVCGYCKKSLSKGYICLNCKDDVHFFCCMRKLSSNKKKTLVILCLKCTVEGEK